MHLPFLHIFVELVIWLKWTKHGNEGLSMLCVWKTAYCEISLNHWNQHHLNVLFYFHIISGRVCVLSRSWFSSKILSRIYKLETYQMDLSFRRGYVTCAQMCTFCEGKFSHARHARIQFNDNRLRKWGPHAVSSFIFLHSLLKSKVLRKHTKLTLFAALHLCQSIVVDVV